MKKKIIGTNVKCILKDCSINDYDVFTFTNYANGSVYCLAGTGNDDLDQSGNIISAGINYHDRYSQVEHAERIQ